jgi:hypothetical protein
MADFAVNLPIATVTNPILLWLFKKGWEDPEWGRRSINQAALGFILQDVSEKLADRGLKKDLQALARKVIVENTQG